MKVLIATSESQGQGWAEYLSEADIEETIVGELAELVVMLRDIAAGEVVERWGPGLRVRHVRAA